MAQLEALEAITTFCFLADDIQNTVDELGALGIMALGPIVACTSLSEDKVVWTERESLLFTEMHPNSGVPPPCQRASTKLAPASKEWKG